MLFWENFEIPLFPSFWWYPFQKTALLYSLLKLLYLFFFIGKIAAYLIIFGVLLIKFLFDIYEILLQILQLNHKLKVFLPFAVQLKQHLWVFLPFVL